MLRDDVQTLAMLDSLFSLARWMQTMPGDSRERLAARLAEWSQLDTIALEMMFGLLQSLDATRLERESALLAIGDLLDLALAEIPLGAPAPTAALNSPPASPRLRITP